jgi:hypothetical protein
VPCSLGVIGSLGLCCGGGARSLGIGQALDAKDVEVAVLWHQLMESRRQVAASTASALAARWSEWADN